MADVGRDLRLQDHVADVKSSRSRADELELLAAEDRKRKQKATSPGVMFSSPGGHDPGPSMRHALGGV